MNNNKLRGLSLVLLAIILLGLTGLEQPARWWKGNTHSHSLWSDGDAAPEFVADWYMSHGYNFLVISDHDIYQNTTKWLPMTESGKLTEQRAIQLHERFGDHWVETRETGGEWSMRLKTLPEIREELELPGEFILIGGVEISESFEGRPVHLNALNIQDLVGKTGGSSPMEIIRRNILSVEDHGLRYSEPVLVHVNHPNFGWGLEPDDIARTPGVRFFEVMNAHPSVRNYGNETHPGTEAIWDYSNSIRLQAGFGDLVYGVATDDAHNYFDIRTGRANPGRAWVMVRATELTPAAIIRAYDRGDFYSSSGVTLSEVRYGRRSMVVRIDAEEGVTYTTLFIGTRRVGGATGEVGEVLFETAENPAVYRFEGDEIFVRAKVISSKLHPNPYMEGDFECAWVQPVVPGRR